MYWSVDTVEEGVIAMANLYSYDVIYTSLAFSMRRSRVIPLQEQI